jgi:soluble lytic murein transglycosylase
MRVKFSKLSKHGLLGLLVLALVACNFGGTDATAIPPSPTVYAAPSPSPIPPDPIPGAAKALADGDFDAARTQYTTALATPALTCEALYGLGMTELRAQQYPVAESYFTRSLKECQPTFRAYVNRGEARRLQTGRGRDAAADYQEALTLRPSVLDSYLYERIYLATNDVTMLARAADAPRYLAGQFYLRNLLAAKYLETEEPLKAIKQYEAILAAATKPDYRAEVAVNAAKAELAGGLPDVAYQRLNAVIKDSADSPAALQALILLVNGNQSVDLLTRSKINVKNGNYAPVLQVLTDYVANTPPEEIAPEYYVLLGIAQRQTLPEAKTAIATFQLVRERYPTDPQAAVATLELGRTYFNAKDYLNAVNTYITVANNYPNAPEAPEALWRAGYLAQTYLDAKQAVPIYGQLVGRYPQTERAKQAAFDAGLILSATDPANAATFFEKAGDTRGLLWQGKMLSKVGKAGEARKVWETAAARDPNDFFSQRARDLLDNRAPYQPLAKFDLNLGSTDADRVAAENWLRAAFNQPYLQAALPEALNADPMLRRGTELWALGWTQAARAEFDALQEAKKDDATSLFPLAVYYRGLGIYRSSVIAAARVIALAQKPYQTLPAYLLRLAYPVYYADLTVREAQTYKVDPLFYAALIRLESLWEYDALSVSDARGLTQVIPTTANDIFGRLQWPPNFTPDDLYRPIISLRYGAYYVDFVRRYLGGNLAGTLAGYNAGPGAASGWLKTAGDDLDLLYETITSGQAQDYVRITYENFTAYRYLYGR